MFVATALVASMLMPAAGPDLPGPDLLSLGFQVINMNSRMCLTATGSAVEQRHCDRSDAVRWRFRPASVTGLFEIVHHRSDRCLSTAGDAVVLASCDAASRWQLLDSAGSTAQLRSQATGRCLTIAGGSRAEGADAVPYDCDDKRSRRWTVRLIAAPFM